MIIGAGIGGLAAAIGLAREGHEVQVFEQATEIRPLGVGINILPHAIGVLTKYGLGEALAAAAIETREYVFLNRFGQEILADPCGLAAGYPHPQYSIHRGALQMLLYDAACAAIGPERIRTGHRLVGFDDLGDRVRAAFARRADGDATAEAEADIMIAADGIHSAARAKFYPDEGLPKWNGVMMWRGVTEGPSFLSGASLAKAGNRDQKFTCYPISPAHAAEGRALINWICNLRQEGRTLPAREDWSRTGRLEDFLPRFESWRFPFLDVPWVIRNAQAAYEFPMVDRDPVARWSFGRVALLGDAAHPMYPIGSNGATQAIMDVRALADALAREADPVAALRAYEAERLPQAAEIVRMNRSEGSDAIMDIVEERAPQGFARIDDVMPRAELAAMLAKYKQSSGYRQNAGPRA
jgi:2-polyprenyl-6-methoxyphenol hydroxylase-like FAD-dependent oxidoreductase